MRVPLPCARLEIVLVHHEPHETGGIHKPGASVPERKPESPRILQTFIAQADLAEAGRIRAGPVPVRGDSCCGCVGVAPGGNAPVGLHGSCESEGCAPDDKPQTARSSLIRSAQHPDGSVDHAHHEEREKNQEREAASPLRCGGEDDGGEKKGFEMDGSFYDAASAAGVTGTVPSGQGPCPELSIPLRPASPSRPRCACPRPGGCSENRRR